MPAPISFFFSITHNHCAFPLLRWCVCFTHLEFQKALQVLNQFLASVHENCNCTCMYCHNGNCDQSVVKTSSYMNQMFCAPEVTPPPLFYLFIYLFFVSGGFVSVLALAFPSVYKWVQTHICVGLVWQQWSKILQLGLCPTELWTMLGQQNCNLLSMPSDGSVYGSKCWREPYKKVLLPPPPPKKKQTHTHTEHNYNTELTLWTIYHANWQADLAAANYNHARGGRGFYKLTAAPKITKPRKVFMEEIGTSVAFMQYFFKLHYVFFLHHQIERIQREVAMFCLELGCTQQLEPIYEITRKFLCAT